MKKRNVTLFIILVLVTIVWGAAYWYFVAPVIDPR
ncbi:YdgA family protein [Sporosarcina sp. G11-34]|nr:YdgA family protein [Sporosarcina sp. G11-34]